jgi:hypothetical protein
MSTATSQSASQVIADSLLAINVIRAGQSPTASMLEQGVRRLNQMMALWESDGNEIGYIPVGTVTDILTVPDAAILGIVNNLAIHMAPSFGATVPPEIIALAQLGMQVIDKITAVEVLVDLDLQRTADQSLYNIGID